MIYLFLSLKQHVYVNKTKSRFCGINDSRNYVSIVPRHFNKFILSMPSKQKVILSNKFFVIIVCMLLSYFGNAQQKKSQKLKFCGAVFSDLQKLKTHLQPQFDFLQVKENDTIVDIGASSGWFDGAVSAGTEFNNLLFVLVDIDTICLNPGKIDAMVSHYSKVKGRPILNQFQIINNTPDSLWLPLNTYPKVLLMNTLHEIPNQNKIARDIHSILREGGELILLEMKPTKKGELHFGCKKPLLDLEEMKLLFEKNGFRYAEAKEVRNNKRSTFQLVRFIK